MALTKKRKIFLLWWYRGKYLGSRRRFWIHPICKQRETVGEFKLLPQILSDDDKCLDYLRMKQTTFNFLLLTCTTGLQKQNTNWRKAISPTERLVVTLRYLATGNSFRGLAFSFRQGVCIVQRIVRSTCRVLWSKLQPIFMPKPDKEVWTRASEDFYAKWSFPNCVGAIDGKHVRIKKPALSGARHWNYKGFCSVVLLAVADANGRFLVIDVGNYGSCSDGGIFRASQFGQLLMDGRLGLPTPQKITNTEQITPPVFVADEAFPLMVNLMKPFPRRKMTLEERVFNYRLSRARRQVECSFGILSNTWRILLKAIETSVGPALDTVKAICLLHNVLLAQEPERLSKASELDDSSMTREEVVIALTRTASQEANGIRKTLCSYFVSPTGSLPWQNEACLNNL